MSRSQTTVGLLNGVTRIQAFLKKGLRRFAVGKNSASVNTSSDQTSSTKEFCGYSLKLGQSPCAAARALEGVTFTAGDNISLPLFSCTKASCNCEKKCVNERRELSRRKMPDRRVDTRMTLHSSDRRGGPGRRAGDQIQFLGFRHTLGKQS